jgi:hypothetical protein
MMYTRSFNLLGCACSNIAIFKSYQYYWYLDLLDVVCYKYFRSDSLHKIPRLGPTLALLVLVWLGEYLIQAIHRTHVLASWSAMTLC